MGLNKSGKQPPAAPYWNCSGERGISEPNLEAVRRGSAERCTVLLDGKPVNSCSMLAAQAVGHRIETIEAVGEHPEQGWRKTEGLSVLQQAFVDSGAIQCGYCTPAMILAGKTLLDHEPDPNEEQVREALSGVLCRCTGYLKPVQAVLRAAAILRGDYVPPIDGGLPAGGEAVPGGWTGAQPEAGG